MLISLSILGREHLALFLEAGYTLSRRWFRATQLCPCPFYFMHCFPCTFWAVDGNCSQAQAPSLPSSRPGMLPCWKRKPPKCSRPQQHTWKCSMCFQESTCSSSCQLLGVWRHTPRTWCSGHKQDVTVLPALPHGSGSPSGAAAENCLYGLMIPFWADCLTLLFVVSFPN